MTNSGRSYHHGNLRDALIIAAAELIEENGSLEFSITDAARRAGVSNAAPYRHFKDKDDLLLNVRELSFLGLHAHLKKIEHNFAKQPDSAERIIALGHGYISYAREKRAFFSLMWEDRGDAEQRKEDVTAKMSGFSVVHGAVDDYCLAQRHHPHSDSVRVATQLWALAHGIATLEINQMLDTFDRSVTPEMLLEESTRALLAGLHIADNPKQKRASSADKLQTSLPLG